MSFYTYILYSAERNQYYIGHSSDLEDRLTRHCNHGSKATRKAQDWIIVYKEAFPSRSEAIQRELAIKRKKSRKYIEHLVSSVR